MIYAFAVLAFVVLLIVVIRRAAHRAEREAKERAAAAKKWGAPEPGKLETMLAEKKPDTRPAWAGEKGGENP